MIKEIFNTYQYVPPLRTMWYIFFVFSANLRFVRILRFQLRRIPGAFMDLLLIIQGKNPK